jgi:hypothetical protein
VFTLGFMLEEFAASKEHGWTGESYYCCGQGTDGLVYSANVGQVNDDC